MALSDNDDVTGLYHLLLGIHTVLYSSVGAEGDEDEVHASGLVGYGHLVHAVKQENVVFNESAVLPLLGQFYVCFLDMLCYHVLMCCVLPAFSLTVLV